MDWSLLFPFSYNPDDHSPEVAIGREAIRVAADTLRHDGERVSFHVHIAFMLPSRVALRYRALEEAMVIVVRDVDQRAGLSVRTANTHVRYPPGARDGPNQVSEPALPIPGRGDLASDGYSGGWVSGGIELAAPLPAIRPSIFLHVVLENYVSNVLALDLLDGEVIDV
ncbi:MAG: hypothetical protein IT372_04615 [Polyangiaceae bacterium]|nr:hypothetical protein [Polyangiaceae bacterium]